MRTKTNVARVSADSGHGIDVLTDNNMATVAGLGLAAVTAGGACFIGAAVAPSQVLGGAAVATGLLVAGHNKAENGAYFAFRKGDTEVTVTTDNAAPAAA